MKNEVTKIVNLLTMKEDLKRVLQDLWDKVDPVEWRYLAERLTCKLEDVTDCKGIQTVH